MNSFEVQPIAGPIDAVVMPPGSKSITNRALVCASLARGTSRLTGALFAEDTAAMIRCLGELGVRIEVNPTSQLITVEGVRGTPNVQGAVLDAGLSGTTARFVAAVAALGQSTVVLDGLEPLRLRPMSEMFEALTTLGGVLTPLGQPGHLPVQIDARGLAGGPVKLRGDVSSQFLSGLLLAAPEMAAGLQVTMLTELVSRPYVEMTLQVMQAFGAHVSHQDDHSLKVDPSGYLAVPNFTVEPDASAASYFFAAAALLGGSVRIDGLGTGSLQGDLAFVDLLERMGATVNRTATSTQVIGTGTLHGIEADMGDFSDTAQTMAALAPFADSPTRITGIGFIRAKETDRIAAVVHELQRLGVTAEEEPDGFVIYPGVPHPGVVQTYHDHRMAMSFALLGLRAPGIKIADPECVAKTYPEFWNDLQSLQQSSHA
ncbi:MAG: 3-phosphoshikimate 1-carboxyvinyltransferase [Microthrixaceae bacterium]